MIDTSAQRHAVERFRMEPRRRTLTVVRTQRLTPKMLRIELTSPDLEGFLSRSPDDHIKIIVPDPATPGETCMRDYTPRAYDPSTNVLTIDFALHESGPVTAWAMGATPGSTLQIGGPRGSQVLPDDFDYYLLVGDETALPSIGRRVEALRAGVPVTTVVVVDAPEEAQHLQTQAAWAPVWVVRTGAADDATLLREALQTWRAPAGEGYVWIAAEASTARTLRSYMLEDRGHPRSWLKAAGYWVRGTAGADEKFDR